MYKSDFLKHRFPTFKLIDLKISQVIFVLLLNSTYRYFDLVLGTAIVPSGIPICSCLFRIIFRPVIVTSKTQLYKALYTHEQFH